ncbi:putative transcriptional elongation protein Spt4 [Polychaeton citri CBS 116435]|uniref:Transcription elongation factor SPT4 n=1 Tax=Polychaeton citri CBS 116435 TaxID=1314669 RepID=A0A9P4Q9M6_9PEZI|nr:putative transcriptional elongation protein Spt4 [Polychaeton citri CBS 116435]
MSTRNHRACMVCSIVLPMAHFSRNGCPNCDDILEMKGNPDQVHDCTSVVFEGLVTLQNPEQSWVARWQRLTHYVKGVYAVKVEGQLPEDVIATMENNGIPYVPRDGSGVADEQ